LTKKFKILKKKNKNKNITKQNLKKKTKKLCSSDVSNSM
jgi:hypothetical protein